MKSGGDKKKNTCKGKWPNMEMHIQSLEFDAFYINQWIQNILVLKL